MRLWHINTIALVAISSTALAQDVTSYHLLNPVPREEMRELSLDRPDTTESPYTVDAGHFQVETELAAIGFDAGATSFDFATINLKVGLASRVDLQVVLSPLALADGRAGLGDTAVRLKLNIWGNDSGVTALAVMPYIKLPTASADFGNGLVEGGIIVPFSLSLPADISSAVMLQLDAFADEDGKYSPSVLMSATAGRAIWGDLSSFIEVAAGVEADIDLSLNTGLVLALSDNVILDAGARVGLTDVAPDFVVFFGTSFRI